MATRVELAAGAVLLRQGDPAEPLYFVEKGSFEIVDPRSTPETVISVVGPGQVLGDMAFVDRAPASAEVRARSASGCLRWSRPELLAALDADPALASAFYRALATAAVARNRALTTAVMVGGFSAARESRQEREDRARQEQAASLAGPLLALAAERDQHSPSVLVEGLSGWLSSTSRWFSADLDHAHAAAVGALLREELREVLSSSDCARALLARPPGEPAGLELFDLVLTGRPSGRDTLGLALDEGMMALDTLRGWAWRDRVLGERLSQRLATSTGRALWISANGPCRVGGLAQALSQHPNRIDLLCLAPSDPSAGWPTLDLLALARGQAPAPVAAYDTVLFDRASDLLPEEALRVFLAWARTLLGPDGELWVAHATPAQDQGMLDHLFGWPSLPRRAAVGAALLPAGGTVRTQLPDRDEAAALHRWTQA